MKLHAEISNQKHEIEITRDGDKVSATIDGRPYEVEVSQPEPGVYLIKNGNRIFEAYFSQSAKPGELMKVVVGGRNFDIRLIDPKRLRSSVGTDEHAGGVAEIKSAMPGKVVRVLLEPGSEVEKGQGVIVVEAMKMQNELKSPKSGVLRAIIVAEGDTVSAGDILASVE